MGATIRFPQPVIAKPLPQETVDGIRQRAMEMKVAVAHVGTEQRILLLFPDIGAAYHIRTIGELDKIIDTLMTFREQTDVPRGGSNGH